MRYEMRSSSQGPLTNFPTISADGHMERPIRRRDILFIEPFFRKIGHDQFNRAFVTLTHKTYPDAKMRFACTTEYRKTLVGDRGTDLAFLQAWHWCEAWPYQEHRVGEFAQRLWWLVRILRAAAEGSQPPTDVIILGATGPILAALAVLRKLRIVESRVFVVLHGNVNDALSNWRPRNPILRWMGFDARMRRLERDRTRVIALESWIQERLVARYPESSRRIYCVPFPMDETERLPNRKSKIEVRNRLVILYLGQATSRKGFPQYLDFANAVAKKNLRGVSFRAAGFSDRDMRVLDQGLLDKKAGTDALPRWELLEELAIADFVFFWQSEYYDLSPSGVLIDCINHGVPLLGRLSSAVARVEADFGPIGLFGEDFVSLVEKLDHYIQAGGADGVRGKWLQSLALARDARTITALSERMRKTLGPTD